MSSIGIKIGIGKSRNPYWNPLTISVENTDTTKIFITGNKVLTEPLPDKSAFALGNKTISSVGLDATKKILIVTVSEGYLYWDLPVLVYNKPSSNPLKAGGQIIPSFTLEVTNNVTDGLEAEYKTIYDNQTTKPASSIAAQQNKMLKAIKDGSVWSDLDSMRLLAQTVNGNNEALKDWKDITKIATLQNAPVFTANSGFQMNSAASRYIDLIFKGSDGVNYGVNDCSLIFYVNANVAETSYDVGTYDGTNYDQINTRTGNNFEIAIHGATVSPANTDSTGLWVFNRINATTIQVFKNGSQVGADIASNVATARSARSFFLGARNNQGVPDSKGNRKYAFVAFGKALTSAKVLALYNAFNTYFTATKVDNTYPAKNSAFVMPTHTASDLSAMRATVRGRIWTGGYPSTGIDHITLGIADPLALSSANLASVDSITLHITGIADRTCHKWNPTTNNGKLVIFHLDHHYGAYYVGEGKTELINSIIDAGYTVISVPMPPSNAGAEGGDHTYPGAAPYQLVTDYDKFLNATIRIINEYTDDYSAIYMTGFSGGGWTTSLIAALDERITKSATICGSLPQSALNSVDTVRDWEQYLIGLTDIIDYGDIYAMAITSGRKLTQYLGARDLYFNLNAYEYAPYGPEMKAISSNFKLEWDTVTNTHEITPEEIVKIVSFFNA